MLIIVMTFEDVIKFSVINKTRIRLS